MLRVQLLHLLLSSVQYIYSLIYLVYKSIACLQWRSTVECNDKQSVSSENSSEGALAQFWGVTYLLTFWPERPSCTLRSWGSTWSGEAGSTSNTRSTL